MSPSQRETTSPGLLVFRFSAMGDVILSRHVLLALKKKYPETRVSMVSQEFFRPVFDDIPDLNFIGVDFKNRHKGLAGLWRLSREFVAADYRIVADLHNVLRSRILCYFMSWQARGFEFYHIDKGRSEKRKLTRRFGKVMHPLKHTTQRYADVFAKSGFPLSDFTGRSLKGLNQEIKNKKTRKPKIGIAPLSRHLLKEWPARYMTLFMEKIAREFSCEFYLLGGPGEKDKLEKYLVCGAISLAGKNSFSEEIEILKKLDLVISMDSGNMHLAGMLGIPVISFWGPTHPYAGFSPVGSKNLTVQNSRLECRPCSVFGNKPCFRKDHACMTELYPEEAFRQTNPFIRNLFRNK